MAKKKPKKAAKAAKGPEGAGKMQGKGSEATQFKPGQSGNPGGKRPGTRNRFCKQMLEDFATVWREAVDEEGRPGGLQALRKVREDKPDAFVRAAMQWVPTEFELGDQTQGAFRQIWEALANGKIPKPETESGDDD